MLLLKWVITVGAINLTFECLPLTVWLLSVWSLLVRRLILTDFVAKICGHASEVWLLA